MADSPNYKELYLQEQRRRENAERRREEAEQAQERAEDRTRKTTLLELLDACHTHLYSRLTVQPNASLSTQGNPANAKNKLRPERIRAWEDFPAQQEAIWYEIMASDFVLERQFTSLHTLEESGDGIRQRMMSSELDLHLFQRSTLEDHISSIIKGLYNNPTLRRKFQLQGAITFENHANTLSPESQLEDGVQQMSVSGAQRRRSPRLKAKENPPVPKTPGVPQKISRPRADQFCVYNTSGTTQDTKHHIAAFIVEYKAPHKLPLGFIYDGLHDIDLEDLLCDTDTPQQCFPRLIAAIITQAFSYMVQAGLEYGCVCTGEASIFLRVPDDPRTVEYFLSVPKGDVGATTGWAPNSQGPNRLHLTALGQMLAFTLQALKTPPRSHRWRAEAAATLNSWEIVYDDLFEKLPEEEKETTSSEYRPSPHNEFLRMSPVQLRLRPTRISTPDGGPAQDQREASDEEPDADTPSRTGSLPQRLTRNQVTSNQPTASSSSSRGSRYGAQSGQYCTQNCLRGLVDGGLLDMSCPNARNHGKSHHRIDQPTFLTLIREQLSQDLDTNCSPVGRPGACGVLFRIRLEMYGYTVAAKCTPIEFVHRLRHEAMIYEHLRPIQGIHIPVCLGNIDLVQPYFFEGIAQLVHMMFLSFGGERISQHISVHNKSQITQRVKCSTQAIHKLGVLHNDLAPRNILWSSEISNIMVIDFERAELVKPRASRGVASRNRKRMRGSPVKRQIDQSAFTRETGRAAGDLCGLLPYRV